MEFPKIEKMTVDGSVCKVWLTETTKIDVTVTDSLKGAKLWLNSERLIHNRHSQNLQVGADFHGEDASLVTLSLGKKALVVKVKEEMKYGRIKGRLANFLAKRTSRFVTWGQQNVANLDCECVDAMELGLVGGGAPSFGDLAYKVVQSRIELDPAVVAGDWSAWPLSDEQVLVSSVTAHVCYLAALKELKKRQFDEDIAAAMSSTA